MIKAPHPDSPPPPPRPSDPPSGLQAAHCPRVGAPPPPGSRVSLHGAHADQRAPWGWPSRSRETGSMRPGSASVTDRANCVLLWGQGRGPPGSGRAGWTHPPPGSSGPPHPDQAESRAAPAGALSLRGLGHTSCPASRDLPPCWPSLTQRAGRPPGLWSPGHRAPAPACGWSPAPASSGLRTHTTCGARVPSPPHAPSSLCLLTS